MADAHFILFRDHSGNWCAALPDFRDAAVDPTGWGATREDAVWNLIRDREFRHRAQRECWPEITVADFVEINLATFQVNETQRRRKSFKLIPGGKTGSDPASA
jgi:hypothetical protein